MASGWSWADCGSRTDALLLSLNRLRTGSAFARWCAVAQENSDFGFVRSYSKKAGNDKYVSRQNFHC
jgi:hypothetical protein